MVQVKLQGESYGSLGQVAVKELKFTYHNPKTILFTRYHIMVYSLIQVP